MKRRDLLCAWAAIGTLSHFALPDAAQAAEEIATPVFQQKLPNVPGKRIVAVRVDYGPGGKSAAHHHAASAFIFAYVLAGAIRSQVGDEPSRVFRAGESFYEVPGSEHRISENASQTELASLLAVFIVGEGDDPLTIPRE